MLATLAGTVLVLGLSGGVGSTSSDMVLGALAPAPQKVVLETRSFGTVTVDHAAHLARRAACKTCHGPGPIVKIERFEPKVAHERCVGCHKAQEKGPIGCRECHAVPAPATTVATAAAPGAEVGAAASASGSAATPGSPGSAAAPAAGAAVLAAATPATPEPDAMATYEGGGVRSSRFLRIVSVGYSVMGGPGQDVGTGPAVSFSMREGDALLLYTLERGSTSTGARTVGLLGAGLSHGLWRGWRAFGAVLGGFDAGEAPVSVVPTVGLRAGAEWLGRRMNLALAFTAATDLAHQTTRTGQEASATTFSFGAAIGYVIGQD